MVPCTNRSSRYQSHVYGSENHRKCCFGQGSSRQMNIPPVSAPTNLSREKLIQNGERLPRPASINYHQMFGRPSKPAPRQRPVNTNFKAYEKQAERTGEALLAGWVFDLDSIFSEAAKELLEAKSRSVRHKWRGNHWLCRVLWNAAELLNGAQLSDLVGETVKELCRRAKVPQFAANVIGAVASRVIDAALPGSPKQLADFLKVVVALICPDIDNCAHGQKAIDFLLKPGVEAALRDLAGTTGSVSITTLPG